MSRWDRAEIVSLRGVLMRREFDAPSTKVPSHELSVLFSSLQDAQLTKEVPNDCALEMTEDVKTKSKQELDQEFILQGAMRWEESVDVTLGVVQVPAGWVFSIRSYNMRKVGSKRAFNMAKRIFSEGFEICDNELTFACQPAEVRNGDSCQLSPLFADT